MLTLLPNYRNLNFSDKTENEQNWPILEWPIICNSKFKLCLLYMVKYALYEPFLIEREETAKKKFFKLMLILDKLQYLEHF